MKKRTYVFPFLFLLLLAGCQTVARQARPFLEEEGALFMYMDPLPQGEERLVFSLAAVVAVREDGGRIPLALARREIAPDTMNRQHLLASGPLPAGRYAGLSFEVKSAALKGEGGYSRLLPAEVPVQNDFPFEIKRKKAVTLSLSLGASSVRDGFAFAPQFSFAVPPKQLLALTGYVSDEGDNAITVFDKRSGRVSGVIVVGKGPAGIAVDQSRRQAYVALAGEDAVAVIDMMAGEVVNRVGLHAGDAPREIALSPDGRTLLAVNSGSGTVSVIDPFSLNETDRIAVGNNPGAILMDRVGRRAYVFNVFSNSLSVIDVPNRAVAATVATEPAPLRGEFNRNGDKLYLVYEGSPYLTVLDTVSLSVAKRVFVGTGISCLKLDTRTDMLYMGRKNSPTVEGYEPFSLLPADSITAGGEVAQIAVDRDEGNLLFLMPEQGVITAIRPAGKGRVFEMDTGAAPYRMALMGEQ